MGNPILSRNPAFNGNANATPAQLQQMYNAPAAPQNSGAYQQGYAQPGYAPQGYPQQGYPQPQPGYMPQQPAQAAPEHYMTYNSVISKTALSFIILLATAVLSWQIPALAMVGLIGGLILGLVNSFKREHGPVLVLGYALFEGLFLGGVSHTFEAMTHGIVLQAVLGTLVVFGVTLVLFANGKVRTSAKMNKIVFIAGLGYLAFSLINMALVMFDVIKNPWGMSGIEVFGIPLGAIIGIVAVLMAAYTLVGDFENIEYGVQRGLPDKYGWTGTFGLVSTLVWIYFEILRIIALFTSRD